MECYNCVSYFKVDLDGNGEKLYVKKASKTDTKWYDKEGTEITAQEDIDALFANTDEKNGMSDAQLLLFLKGSGGGGGGCKDETTKSVTPTKQQQTVTPNNPSTQTLSNVIVEAIPDVYVDTSDATATPEEIEIGKTAYVNGIKIIGTKTNIAYENELAYGIEWKDTNQSTECMRVGNMDLHCELPIQSMLKGYLTADDGTATKMNENDWTVDDRSGLSGQVMVGKHFNIFYKHENLSDTDHRLMISQFPLDGYKRFDMHPIGAYMSSIQRSTQKLSSVINTDNDYRGGVNHATWDGTYRDLRGKPLTNMMRNDFELYAKNRGDYWHIVGFPQWNMLEIMRAIEYANWDCRLPFTDTLTTEGFKQGGLGQGCSNITNSYWASFNGQNPFINCGLTDTLGNKSGEVKFTMPFEYDSNGEENYVGQYNTTTTYATGQYISDSDKLYMSLIDSNTGNPLTDTSKWKEKQRTVTQQARYRGVDSYHGDLWMMVHGFFLDVKKDSEGGTSTLYVSDEPDRWEDSTFDNFIKVGELARASGFVKTFVNEDCYLVPAQTGATNDTYKARYFDTNSSTTSTFGAFVGGFASSGNMASPGTINTKYIYGYGHTGSRLCYYK